MVRTDSSSSGLALASSGALAVSPGTLSGSPGGGGGGVSPGGALPHAHAASQGAAGKAREVKLEVKPDDSNAAGTPSGQGTRAGEGASELSGGTGLASGHRRSSRQTKEKDKFEP